MTFGDLALIGLACLPGHWRRLAAVSGAGRCRYEPARGRFPREPLTTRRVLLNTEKALTRSCCDVVMWDNGCVLHRAEHAHVVGDRVMHRGMLADYGAG